MRKFLAFSAAVALSSSAFAQVWAEAGDAPELPVPGQATVGVGPLTLISGNLPAGANDADMYCINIVDPINFSAAVTGGTIYDSQLFLFNLGGFGVTHNDDAGTGPIGGWSAIGAGGPGPGVALAPGLYALAISGYNRDPSSAGGLIWANSPFSDETAPDGPGGGLPVISWAGDGDFGTYEITLVGASYCDVPEPTTLALLALGGLALIRRR